MCQDDLCASMVSTAQHYMASLKPTIRVYSPPSSEIMQLKTTNRKKLKGYPDITVSDMKPPEVISISGVSIINAAHAQNEHIICVSNFPRTYPDL